MPSMIMVAFGQIATGESTMFEWCWKNTLCICHSGRSSIQNTPLYSTCLSNTPTFECMPCHQCCICSNWRDGFNPVNCPMCRRMVEAPCAAERSDGESLDNVREIIKKTKYFGLSFTIFVKS